MKNEKPTTEKQKDIANEIYRILLLARKFMSKEDICAKLGWEYNLTNDRKVRDTINLIKKRKPIVATPDKKGYFAPILRGDLDEIVHQWQYVDKVIADLEETKKPLIKFYEKAQKILDNNAMIIV